jgi:hypothetical protein
MKPQQAAGQQKPVNDTPKSQSIFSKFFTANDSSRTETANNLTYNFGLTPNTESAVNLSHQAPAESPMIAPFNDKSLTNITPGKTSKALNQSRENGQALHGPGYHVKVIRKDLATEERRKKRKLQKAIMNLQNEDKHRDIDYKMD